MVLAVVQAPFTVIILVKKLLNLSEGLAASRLSPLAFESNKTLLLCSVALLLQRLPARWYCLACLINIVALSSKETANRERQSMFRIWIHCCSKWSGGNGELKLRYNVVEKMRKSVVCTAPTNNWSGRIANDVQVVRHMLMRLTG